MLFPGKKCRNSRHQRVVLGIAAFFYYFISNTFCITFAVPSKQAFFNASIFKSKSNFSNHFSKSFVTVPNAPITTGISHYYDLSHFANFCNFILQLTIICTFFFFFLFNASVKWACVIYHYAFVFFLVNNSFIWLIKFKGAVSLYRELHKHKILQFSDSKTFSGLCKYHFSALLKPHSFQLSILATLSCLPCLYSFCASFDHSETICATALSGAPHTRLID